MTDLHGGDSPGKLYGEDFPVQKGDTVTLLKASRRYHKGEEGVVLQIFPVNCRVSLRLKDRTVVFVHVRFVEKKVRREIAAVA